MYTIAPWRETEPVYSLCRIRIVDTAEPKLQVEGFANYTDVQVSDLVPWTPLKAGYSHVDTDSALFILQRVAQQFLGVVASEASTLPDGEGQSYLAVLSQSRISPHGRDKTSLFSLPQ